MVHREANGPMIWMKSVVQKVAFAKGVGAGLLAKHVAFRLGQEKVEN